MSVNISYVKSDEENLEMRDSASDLAKRYAYEEALDLTGTLSLSKVDAFIAAYLSYCNNCRFL